MPVNGFCRFAIAISILLLIAVGRGSAQHMNATDAPCRNVGPNSELTRCLNDEAQKAGSDLNLLNKRIRQTLSSANLRRSQVAERLWMQFRDATCNAERNLYQGGSAAPAAYLACMAAETRQHTADLNVIYGWILSAKNSRSKSPEKR